MGEGGIGEGESNGTRSDKELEGINSVEIVGSAKIVVKVPMKLVLISVGILGEGGVTNGWIGGKDEFEVRIEVGLSEVQWGRQNHIDRKLKVEKKSHMEIYAHKKWHI